MEEIGVEAVKKIVQDDRRKREGPRGCACCVCFACVRCVCERGKKEQEMFWGLL